MTTNGLSVLTLVLFVLATTLAEEKSSLRDTSSHHHSQSCPSSDNTAELEDCLTKLQETSTSSIHVFALGVAVGVCGVIVVIMLCIMACVMLE